MDYLKLLHLYFYWKYNLSQDFPVLKLKLLFIVSVAEVSTTLSNGVNKASANIGAIIKFLLL